MLNISYKYDSVQPDHLLSQYKGESSPLWTYIIYI